MKKFARALSVIISAVLCVACFSFVACKKTSRDSITFSVQELDNVFNPYFSTSGYDSEIVGNTQISMFSSDKNGNVYCGEDVPSVALDYSNIVTYDQDGNGVIADSERYDPNIEADNTRLAAAIPAGTESSIPASRYYTTYQLLLKNGIRFSDGTPLTIRDVIFNLYALLDPAYYGSATVYSTAIKGLTQYRTQNPDAVEGAEDTINEAVRLEAYQRMSHLRLAYNPDNDFRKQYRTTNYNTFAEREELLKDVELARLNFYDEVQSDWAAAEAELESYKEENDKTDATVVAARRGFTETWEIFLYNYGFIRVTEEKDEKGNTRIKTYNVDDEGFDKYGNRHKKGDKMIDYNETWKWFHDKENLTKIVYNSFLGLGDTGNIFKYENSNGELKEIANAEAPVCDITVDAQGKANGSSWLSANSGHTEEEYWNELWNGKLMVNGLYNILVGSVTSGTLNDKFMGDALQSEYEGKDIAVPTIEGIKVLRYKKGETFKGVNNLDGLVLDEDSYVLQIQVDRVDPKAIFNFGITVAPMNYYSNADNVSQNNSNYALFQANDYEHFNYPVCDSNGVELNEKILIDDPYFKNDGNESRSRIWDPKAPICVGRPFASREYFDSVVKASNIISVPVGAGMYQVSSVKTTSEYYMFETNSNGEVILDENGQPKLKGGSLAKASENRPTFGEFDADNIIYFIRNPFFFTTSGNIRNPENHIESRDYGRNKMCNCKIKNVRYKIITATKLLDSILQGEIDYGDPNGNQTNETRVNAAKNVDSETVENNGYGYIGINATYVPDLEVRRAIMLSFNTELIQAYYGDGFASIIHRPISTSSWASPENEDGNPLKGQVDMSSYKKLPAEIDYSQLGKDELVKERIKDLISAKYPEKPNNGTRERKLADGTTHKLKYTFTIAGSTDDHPAYATMQHAAEILNDCGFDITVKTDSNALSKLAAGTLTVWAAAWSSGNDPDMYQIYHEDSKATSVNNWGYPTILANKTSSDYAQQYAIIQELSELIDKGRSTLNQKNRAETYLEALDKIMELAVEFPTYQRNNFYVYRTDVIKESTLNQTPTAFSGLLDRMWEVELV